MSKPWSEQERTQHRKRQLPQLLEKQQKQQNNKSSGSINANSGKDSSNKATTAATMEIPTETAATSPPTTMCVLLPNAVII